MDEHQQAQLLLHLARDGAPRRAIPPVPDLVLRGGLAALRERFGDSTGTKIHALRSAGEPDLERERADRLGVRIVIKGDLDYPPSLQDHPISPPVIYLRGQSLADVPRVAIVGARKASPTLLEFAAALGDACARANLPVVSGLARGIDSAAHVGCLDAGGYPIGVLGTGIDQVYPPEGTRLHQRVMHHGVLVSTFPIGARPLRYRFPLRNQLVAALSAAVCVVQATLESGSMSTAAAALETNTEVLAVPGAIDDPRSAGTNRLLRDGARPVLEPGDLTEAIVGASPVAASTSAPRTPLSDEEKRLLEPLIQGPRRAEELAASAQIGLDRVIQLLLGLELSGAIERLPGKLYRARGW